MGDEREFEDYFRKEEPADLIPRLENVLERLDGHDDQELEVAAEIVQYVADQLEAMDEDTAGDDSYGDRGRSEAEKRDTCDNGRCNGGPSPAASENVPNADGDNSGESPNRVGGLEPAAYLIGEPGYAGLFFNEEHFVREKMYESLDEAREAAAKHEDFDFEPLGRLSDARQAVHHIIDKAQDDAKQNDSWSFQTHQIVEWLQEQINEEFTQNGGTEC